MVVPSTSRAMPLQSRSMYVRLTVHMATETIAIMHFPHAREEEVRKEGKAIDNALYS